LIVDGVLKAQGASTDRIVFTSIKDDTHGGDTNGDGSASAAAPNDWGWIEYANTSVDNENVLEYVTILYGGKDRWNYSDHYFGAVRLIGASPTISNSTFSYNSSYAIGIDTGSFPAVIDNTFTDNGTNGIGVYEGTITTDGSWTSVNYPYVLNSDIYVAEGASLTISPGVIVKGLNNTRLIVDGVLKAQGASTDRIVFTSIKDDTHGGDTNGDGSASAPAPNDWGWIEFRDTSVDSENLLEYVTILYGGKDRWNYGDHHFGAIRLVDASPTIRNNLITRNNRGIWTSGASFPYITGNAIYRNLDYAFYNEGQPLVVKAENNWWGHATGPYDPSDDPDDPTHLYNPEGQGDMVSDYVDYMPWKESPTTQPYILLDGFAFLPDQAGKVYITTPPGRSLFLAVPFNCEPTDVEATYDGNTYQLSDPDEDDIWTTNLPGLTGEPQTYSLSVVAIGGSCSSSAWDLAQVTLIDPSGYVYNSISGSRIAGAKVSLYYYDTEQEDYLPWNALQFDQVNPQTTEQQGRYGWEVPAGSYFVIVEKNGYENYKSAPVTVPPPVTDLNIPLTPAENKLFLYLPTVIH
jgi:parallel beta-helix repeat protein